VRLGRIRFVAFDAKYSRIEFGRNDTYWVNRVLRQRPVAGFAEDAGVLPGSFLLENLTVTRLARAMTREGHRLGRDLFNGIAAIISILAKAAGHKAKTHNRENGNPGKKDRYYSKKVLGFSASLKFFTAAPAFGRTG
jgi:hypothetical protein